MFAELILGIGSPPQKCNVLTSISLFCADGRFSTKGNACFHSSAKNSSVLCTTCADKKFSKEEKMSSEYQHPAKHSIIMSLNGEDYDGAT